MSRLLRMLAVSYLFLSIYSFGGAVVEEFVYYPAWKVVGAAEFPGFHQSLSERLIPTFVIPFFLSGLANLLLAWRRPPELSQQLVLRALGLNAIIIVTTIWLAIPIQMQLLKAQSIPAIDQLIAYDRPLRLVPGIILGVINWLMLYRLFGRDLTIATSTAQFDAPVQNRRR